MPKPTSIKRIVPLAIVMAGLGATLAFAGPIEDRQEAMKANGKAMGPLVSMFKGETAFDAGTAKKEADVIHMDFMKAAVSFPPDSKDGQPETRAKPEIWSDPDGFKAELEKAMAAAMAVGAATDEASFKAAFPALGGACQSCHEKYRKPKG